MGEAWRISPRSLRLFCQARLESWNDQLRLATMAAWNGQLFHGRLMSHEGLTSAAIDEVLPRKRMTPAQKRAMRDAEMGRRVAAINAVFAAREQARLRSSEPFLGRPGPPGEAPSG